MGAGVNGQGTTMLLQAIEKYFASPEKLEVMGTNLETEEPFEANYQDANPLSVKVWKTLVDPFIGKYSYVKVCSGVLRADSVLYNTSKEVEEKIAKLIETGMTEKAAQGLIVPDVCNDIGYAACYLTNNSATIRNAKKRTIESKDSNPKKKRHTK